MYFKRIHPNAKLPTYGTAYADCFDFYAPESVTIPAHKTVMVKAGLIALIPIGCAMHIYARSGLSIKRGIVLANSVGIIDSDYRNELVIALHNTTDEVVTIEADERIAQGRIVNTTRHNIQEYFGEITQIGDRTGGLGSTGK